MPANELLRPWDAFDAYLFDIDGTLLNCQDAVHYFAFCDALGAVAGRAMNLDGVVTHGNTDEGILRDAFTRGGVDEATWRTSMPSVRDRIGAQVEANREQMCIDVLPGVHEVLTHLRERGAVLSTATGNLARVGRTKLQQCALLDFFGLEGFSDTCESRSAVFGRALAQVRAHVGRDATVCVVGDTPADVQAAHAHGLEVIAVATGIYTRDQLEAEQAELTIGSFLELPGVLVLQSSGT